MLRCAALISNLALLSGCVNAAGETSSIAKFHFMLVGVILIVIILGTFKWSSSRRNISAETNEAEGSDGGGGDGGGGGD